MTTYLLKDVSVDTIGSEVKGIGGGKVIQVSATNFGGGSVSIEGRLDSGLEWNILTYGGNPAIFTSGVILKLDFWAATMSLRAVLAGSTGATAVNVALSD